MPNYRAVINKVDASRTELTLLMNSVASFFDHHPMLKRSQPPVVHSVKARFKSTERLKDKIRRKSTTDPITSENVFERVTDLVGVRVLHLHQAQFPTIHEAILDKINVKKDWVLGEPVKAYTWDPESTSFFQTMGIGSELKDSFYTSVHYLVRPQTDSHLCCEIQVRTLFEEIWGEIDHMLNYPEPTRISSCHEQIRVLAKLVGAGGRLVDSIVRSSEENSRRRAIQ